MNLEELRRQVVKLENWIRRIEDRFLHWAKYIFVSVIGWVGIGNRNPQAMLHVGAGTDTPVLGDTLIYASAAGSVSITARDSTNDIETSITSYVDAGYFGTATNHALKMYTNNATKMTILGDGKVGIGITSPAVPLHIAGATGELLRLDDSSATGSPFLTFYQSTTRRSYIAHIDTADELRLASEYGAMTFWTGTGGTETLRATIDNAGLFGIGESSPATTLHVVGTGIRVQRSTGAAFIQLGLTGSTTDGGSIYGIAGEVGLSFHSGFGGTERMRINSNGQVGIGVTSFTGGLTVGNGRAQFTANTAPSTGIGVEVGHDATTGTVVSFDRDGSAYKALRLNALNHDFYLSGSVAAVLDSSGNFGIGDSTPDGKLDVVQASTTAAIPVVELNQADLSEEFINFITTIGTGNPIEAVGAKTLTTTHFIRIQVNGVGYRYFPVGTIA